MSCNCLADLLRLLVALSCRRGVKNLVKRLGVIVGGLLGLMPISGDDRMSFSIAASSTLGLQVDQNRARKGGSYRNRGRLRKAMAEARSIKDRYG